jgi:hypothetical protein
LAYSATAYKVMIASPSDVAKERQLIREVVLEWNYINSEDRRIVLMPVGWETHSSPMMGTRPQEVINKQVLSGCDLLVAAFWTRIGTPTGTSASGTVEEIEEHISAGKPAMIYFSTAPVHLESVDEEQYAALRKFKRHCQERGLIECYDSLSDLREKFARQLAVTVIRTWVAESEATLGNHGQSIPYRQKLLPQLTDTAKELLIEASKDDGGIVIRVRTHAGLEIQTNGREFIEAGDARFAARWDSALEELVGQRLLQDQAGKGEVFRVTDYGFQVADQLSTGGLSA